MPVHSILCPLDFSEASRAALRMAGRCARRFRASLHVAFVQDPSLGLADADPDSGGYPDLCDELERFVADTQDLYLPAEPAFHVVAGSPPVEIVSLAEREGIDLIVMGAHGFTGVREGFFGSTTARVLRRSTVPLLIVPVTEAADKARDLCGPGPILVLSDFGPAATGAAVFAARLAEAMDGHLLLVHVMPRVAVPSSWRSRAEAVMDLRAAEAHRQMCRAMAPLEKGRPVESAIAQGNIAENVADLARTHHAGLIVIGFERDALGSRPGSTAYQVICSAPVPVLAVPAPD